jgi:MerR family transcriptional regulator, light-induced transcriptional regulator
MQYFNIQLASQLSGVASATIRAWEKRYNAVKPERSENHHRLYSEADIEKLSLLFKLTELGQSIGKIAHLELPELKKVYSSLLHRPYDEKEFVTPHHEKIDFEKMLSSFVLALSAYKLDIISHELEKASITVGPRDLCLNVVIPLFQRIGQLVEKKELNIAQEHAITSLFTFYLGKMLGQYYQNKMKRNDLVLITTPEGDYHGIGILAASLLCIHHGIKFIFLGPNMPSASLAEMANALKAKAILLGVTGAIQPNMPFENYISDLKYNISGPTKIWVGGNLQSSVIVKLEKQKISFFSSLENLDNFLAKY